MDGTTELRPGPFVSPGSYHNRLVPSGTVAARIEVLQGATDTPIKQTRNPQIEYARHDSAASFGTRTSPYFHTPAQRPTYEVREPKVREHPITLLLRCD